MQKIPWDIGQQPTISYLIAIPRVPHAGSCSTYSAIFRIWKGQTVHFCLHWWTIQFVVPRALRSHLSQNRLAVVSDQFNWCHLFFCCVDPSYRLCAAKIISNKASWWFPLHKLFTGDCIARSTFPMKIWMRLHNSYQKQSDIGSNRVHS
jgi:hypothetical protein